MEEKKSGTPAGAPQSGRDEAAQKKKKTRNLILNILIVVFAAVLAFSAWQLISLYLRYKKGTDTYNKEAAEVVSTIDPAKEDGGEGSSEDTRPVAPIQIDWDKLGAQNEDVVGWIYCPDTRVNYPVLQGEDNAKYLHHMITKEYNFAGSIFMDYRNKPDLSDTGTIIYGHHMKNGSMFQMLHNYVDQSYYDEHPVFWYLTPNGNWRLDLIGGFLAEEDDDIYTIYGDPKDMQKVLEKRLADSTFKPKESVDVSAINHAVILSTCAYEYKNARYVLLAVPVACR